MSPDTCSCIEGKFRLIDKYYNSSLVILHDLSDWVENGKFVRPETVCINVSTPGTSSTKVDLDISGAGILSSEEIGGPLSDGLYTFVLDNCGTVYTQELFLIPETKCRLEKLRIKQWDKFKDEIIEIDQDILVMESAGRSCNTTAAAELFDKISRKMDALDCEKCK